ncbi:MAG: hypothetical protein MUC49_15245 [Raineya sp.]|jgi:hypothetical protein|nr:hypothetical protein [Raineya sp.]
MSNTPLLDDFLEFANVAKLSFFTPKADYSVSALNYLPNNPRIKKEDFVLLGFKEENFYNEEYKRLRYTYFIWKINPNENLENQPVVMALESNFTPIGVIARNFRTFLSMLIYPKSMDSGLVKTYIYHDKITQKQVAELPTGKIEWEFDELQNEEKKNGQNTVNEFLGFLEKHQILLCEDIYKTVFEAVNSFEHLDSKSFIHQLTKNFPDMQMPALIRDFYVLIDKHNISLTEFEDDRGNHISESGIIPYFVRADLAHYFIKLGLTGSGGYYAIWLIFPDKKVEDNPVLLLDSEASPVAVVARNFQEYLCIAHTNIYAFISDIESDAEAGREIETMDDTIIQEHLEYFKEENKADEYENLPEKASLWFDFVAKNTPDVEEKNPFQIIKNAYLTMPNLLEWLKKEMPEMWN